VYYTAIEQDEAPGGKEVGSLFQECRVALRGLFKSPIFSAIAILSLGLGIGVNTAIFSLINAVLLRPLPVEHPEELLRLESTDQGGEFHAFTYPDYLDLRDRNQVFSGLLAHGVLRLSLNTRGEPELIPGELVSGNYFSVLGVHPELGRGFLPDEDRTPGTHPVVVLSHELWRSHFGMDPAIVGKSILVNGNNFTVVGVAPASFRGTFEGGIVPTGVWVPTMMHAQASNDYKLDSRVVTGFELVGRRKPGVSVDAVKADLTVLARQLAQTYPDTNKDRGVAVQSLESILPTERGPVVAFMSFLMIVVGLVLLIACSNLTNLILARNSFRQKEIATRLALGIGRGRLTRGLLIESFLIAFAGGALGLLLGYWSTRILSRIQPPLPVPIQLDLSPDLRVLVFCIGISLLAALLFGLTPALHASKPDLVSALKISVSPGRKHLRLRRIFIVAQVALSLLLLIVAGLLVRSLGHVATIDPGFAIRERLLAEMDLGSRGYDEQRGRRFLDQLLERAQALPGVSSATLSTNLPLGLSHSKESFIIQGQKDYVDADFGAVGRRYFETLGIPLLRGRDFGPQDVVGTPGVVIINEAMGNHFWPGQDPLGKRISFSGLAGPYSEVVGVVRNSNYRSLGESPLPFLYVPLAQRYRPNVALVVHTTGQPEGAVPPVRKAVHEIDPNLPLLTIETLSQHVGRSVLPIRFAATLLGFLGILVLVLAGIGLYGVIAFMVSQRVHEIGIRMAIGAQRADVIWLVLRQGLTLVAIGAGIGLLGAMFLTRLLTSLLYGISATDPLVFVGNTLLIIAVALFASFVPARSGSRLNPQMALRRD
jgi:macrolide transport system ATP-binding/permease protein